MTTMRMTLVACLMSAILMEVACVKGHDVTLANCTGKEYDLQVLNSRDQVVSSAAIRPGGSTLVRDAVTSATETTFTFVYRSEGVISRQEKLSWLQLKERNWVIMLCSESDVTTGSSRV